MENYSIKVIKIEEEIKEGDFFSRGNSYPILVCKNLNASEWNTPICLSHTIWSMPVKKVRLFLCDYNIKKDNQIVGELVSNNINEGDKVVVEFTDGYEPNGELIVGILTKKWNEEGPYCQIDNGTVDLAGEGHSSNVYKIITALI